ncbi:TetR family transcriptional regulator C-terminal domain-containing protein [Thermogutta sp.]|uniref:TetR/AcrR family transcriptional regulator n=1 Tax=Thermogutta sp. TaxID=1962930 RepID=UPI00321FB21F
MGITKGSLYYYFPGKDDLGLAVLERAKKRFLATLDELLAAPTPAQSLEQFFDFVLNKHRSERFAGGCLFGNTALEMSDVNSRFAESVAELFQEWIGRLAKVIRAGQAAGQFRADIPAEDLAEVIVSTIEGGSCRRGSKRMNAR